MLGDVEFFDDGFLSFVDQDFGVGEVLNEGLDVFGGVFDKFSLFLSGLNGKSLVFTSDENIDVFDYLSVGLDMNELDCVGDVFNLYLLGDVFKNLLIELVFEGGDEVFLYGLFI